MKLKITEVGPRDGLQNEAKILSLSQRRKLVSQLIAAGVKHIEPGSFVSPQWVPQMAGSGPLHKSLCKTGVLPQRGLRATYLVPNRKGMTDAIRVGVKDIAIFAASSESFAQKNTNCSIAESLTRMEEVVALAKANGVAVRAYLSTVFGCPYEGKVSEAKVLRLTEKIFALGVYELSFGDTIGVAHPQQVYRLAQKIQKILPNDKIAMHFHDTQGMAMANILRCLDLGISNFDTSIGGLGGCPYAKGASGNVATEDVVNMLQQMGLSTGIDLGALVQITRGLEKSLGRKLPSKLAKISMSHDRSAKRGMG